MKVVLHELVSNPYLFWESLKPRLKSKFPDIFWHHMVSANKYFAAKDLYSIDSDIIFTIIATSSLEIPSFFEDLLHTKYIYPILIKPDDFSDVDVLNSFILMQVVNTMLFLLGRGRSKPYLYESEESKRVIELFDRSIEFKPI